MASAETFRVGTRLALADFCLGAMIAFFLQSLEGAALLQNYPRRATWWARLATCPNFVATDPGLAG